MNADDGRQPTRATIVVLFAVNLLLLAACGSDGRSGPDLVTPTTPTAEDAPWVAGPPIRAVGNGMVLRRDNVTTWSFLDSAGNRRVRTLPASVFAARLSPDTKHLAFSAYKGQGEELCLLARDEAAPRCAAAWSNAHRGLEWSPDGMQVVLLGRSGTDAPNTAVVALDTRTMAFRTLLRVGANEGVESLTLTGDGSAVLIVQRGTLLRLALDGSGSRVAETALSAAPTLWQVRWSPDRTRLAVIVNGSCEIGCEQSLFVMNTDGTGIRRLFATSNAEGQLFERLIWAADGGEIAFTVADCLGEPCKDRAELVTVASGMRQEFLRDAVLYDWR